jgi:hypothetical protein
MKTLAVNHENAIVWSGGDSIACLRFRPDDLAVCAAEPANPLVEGGALRAL